MASRRHSTATCKASNNITEEDIKKFDKDARDMFNVFDKDGDKMISVEELSKALRAMGARLTYKEVQIAAKEIDKDKNGKIDYKEFRDFLIPRLKRTDSESQAREAFQIFDRDGNGFIDRKELKQAMKALGEEVTDEDVEEMLAAADINGDGRINYEEFSGIWEAKMKEQEEDGQES